MAGLTTILAGSDLSPWADLALERAAALAGQHDARLALLHVVDPGETPAAAELERLGESAHQFLERRIAQARTTLQARAATLAGQYGAAISATVQTGKDFVEVIRRARAARAELIVLGAHGEHFLREELLGITVERVVRKGERPVLVVRKKPAGPYRRALVAVDFSSHGHRALEWAAALAPQAELHALHVRPLLDRALLRTAGADEEEIAALERSADRASLEELERFLATCRPGGVPIERHVAGGYPGPTIAAEAARLGADLIAVGTHGRSGLLYVLLGSVAAHVLRESPCDVLAVRPAHTTFSVP
jgi:nucleotide-binding universal stress UspA family protein